MLVLGEYVTMRAQVSRKMVDAISEPSVAQTEACWWRSRNGVCWRCLFGPLTPQFGFTENKPNGPCSWVATATYNLGKAVQFRKDLAKGLNNSAEMLGDNQGGDQSGGGATASLSAARGTVCATVASRTRRARRRGRGQQVPRVSPKTTPMSFFDKKRRSNSKRSRRPSGAAGSDGVLDEAQTEEEAPPPAGLWKAPAPAPAARLCATAASTARARARTGAGDAGAARAAAPTAAEGRRLVDAHLGLAPPRRRRRRCGAAAASRRRSHPKPVGPEYWPGSVCRTL